MRGSIMVGRQSAKAVIDGDQGKRIYRGRSQQTFGQGRFHVVFDEPLEELVQRIKTFPGMKVFYRLPRYLTWTEFRPLKQDDLAREVGIARSSASRALVELEALGIIERKGTGPVTQWRLSMVWGWRGNPASYHKAKRERADKQRPKLKVVTGGGPLLPAA